MQVFFVSNALIEEWVPSEKSTESKNVLDKWILSKLNKSIKNITDKGYEKFDTTEVVNTAKNFIVKDLSLWYLRRSRERVGISADDQKDKNDFYGTLHFVLTQYSKVLSPLIPFITEEIYKNLTREESVHLSKWPKVDKSLIDDKLEEKMELVRIIIGLGHADRKFNKIKVRQPLKKIIITITREFPKFDEELEGLIKDELNVKKVVYEVVNITEIKKAQENIPAGFTAGNFDFMVRLDTQLTKELIEEGEARDIIREIQKQRKTLGTTLNEKVDVVLKNWPKTFEDYIKRKASVGSITKGPKFSVNRK